MAMDKRYIKFLIDNFFTDNFFTIEEKTFQLVEGEKSGRSELTFECSTNKNICIENIDQKNTQIKFFKNIDLYGRPNHSLKRVDHIVFEYLGDCNNKFNVHLIEMKSGIENKEKWCAIKGKFRSSYLIAKAIAAMLDIEVQEFFMYTTYEHATLFASDTNLVVRRAPVGERVYTPEEEWSGEKFGLNFEKRLPFKHIPIHMTRNQERGILTGSFSI